MSRSILLISILVVVTIIIVSYVFTQSMSGHDTKILKVSNSTGDESRTGTNSTAQNSQISSVLPAKENVGRITSVPNKCLGSALCPDQ